VISAHELTIYFVSTRSPSPDGCTLYMSSDRAGASDVYVARRPK
jgi:Tol biopolymer transport system component